MIRACVVAAAAGLCMTARAPALTVSAFPSDDTVKMLEKQVTMPPGAEAISAYERYYYLAPKDAYPGHRVVAGTMLLRRSDIVQPTDGRAVRGLSEAQVLNHPVTGPTDGGCAIVKVAFDLDTQRLLPIGPTAPSRPAATAACNGDA